MLTELLSPLSVDHFFSEIWTRTSVYVPGDSGRFRNLFNWHRMGQLLNTHWVDITHPSIRLVLGGQIIPARRYSEFVTSARQGTVSRTSPAKVMELCRDGATMVINAVNRRDSGLAEKAAELSRECGHFVQINAYYSQPGAQGFEWHYDPHEIFIVQVEGKKRWRVAGATSKYPIQSQGYVDAELPVDEPCTHILSAGDLLYLPRGVWHEAVAEEESSLHLTIGMYCSKRLDYAKWLIDRLEDDEFFRENLYGRVVEDGFLEESSESTIDVLIEYITGLRGRGPDLLSDYYSSCAIDARMDPMPFRLPLGENSGG